ncbi:MAG: alpha-1,2-fucosyltransferase [Bacteroidaceae bacterium]|nr:alpha-1,2-fucosyltransferase [Prevotellaceae bacterium]MDY5632687.1 alpha-1,2-fucosyltransferase [Bacteroidaceae bacterium]
MRLIKMTGGLGNQMFIYAFYLRMKQLYPHTRIDLSDMVHYHAHYGYELHRVFPHLPKDEFCINQSLKKVLEFLCFHTLIERKQKRDTLEAFWQPRFWPLIYFKGFYQSERFFADIAPQVRQAFRFSDALASDQTRQLLLRIDAEPNAVSLHVRRGDYQQTKFYNSMGRVCTSRYYVDAVDRMRSHVPDAHFYVFSDDIQWVRSHIPIEEAVYVDFNQDADSWQDMLLMSRCHHNIICNSSFSWWGAWLNAYADKRVIAPSVWCANAPTPDILPDAWDRIEVVPAKIRLL